MWDPNAVAALVVFAGAIALVAVFERYRVVIVASAALLVVAIGWVPLGDLLPSGANGSGSVVEWNALALLVGLLLFGALFGALEIPRWGALKLAGRLGDRPLVLYLALAALAFVLSMFLNSIAVVIVFVPVSLEISRELRIDPVPLLLTEIMSANLGGTATLLGSPPNLILGAQFGLPFSGFLEHAALPAVAALGVTLLWFVARTRLEPRGPAAPLSPLPKLDRGPVLWALALFTVVVMLVALAAPLGLPLWAIGLAGGAIALAIGGSRHGRVLLTEFDWSTILFLLFLFVLVGALETTGVISAVAGSLGGSGVTDPLELGLLLLWTLGVASAFIDNIPLAAVAGPLVRGLVGGTGTSTAPLAYASVIGLGVGGNGTPIGSISNVTALANAERAQVRVPWRRYLRDGLPAMMLGLAAASLVWLVVA